MSTHLLSLRHVYSNMLRHADFRFSPPLSWSILHFELYMNNIIPQYPNLYTHRTLFIYNTNLRIHFAKLSCISYAAVTGAVRYIKYAHSATESTYRKTILLTWIPFRRIRVTSWFNNSPPFIICHFSMWWPFWRFHYHMLNKSLNKQQRLYPDK
jgi:hypothetical protein